MQPRSPKDYLILSSRVSLGLWFLFLGAEKIIYSGMAAFAKNVADHRILMDPWNLPVAYAVVWIEVISGLCLITGWLRRGAARILVGLTLIYIFVTGQAIALGFVPDCGCFGKLFELDPWPKMVLLFVQLALLVFIIVTERHGPKHYFKGSQMRLPG